MGDDVSSGVSSDHERAKSSGRFGWAVAIGLTALVGAGCLTYALITAPRGKPVTGAAISEDAAISACENAAAADFRDRFGEGSSIVFSRRTAKPLPAVGQWIITAELKATGGKAGTFAYGCRLHADGKAVVLPPDSFDGPPVFGDYVRPAPPKGIKAPASGMTDEDVDRLTTYATVLGRASGCGIDVTEQGQNVGNWLLRRVRPGFEKDFYPNLLMNGVAEARATQLAGRSPDDCATVRRSYATLPWPR